MKRNNIIFAGAAAALLMLGATGCATKRPALSTLNGQQWTLSTMNGVPAATLFEGPTPTITFNTTDSVIYGSSGCNRYTGGFTISDDGRLHAPYMASTRMACPFKNAEHEFLLPFASEKGVAITLNRKGVLRIEGDSTVFEFVKDTNKEEE